LLGHFFVAAFGADGRAVGIHALRQEAENPAAFWTGKFVDRHGGNYDLRFAICAPQKNDASRSGTGVPPVCSRTAMMDEQNFSVVNDKNRDGEINFFVDVGHVLPEKI
jgi:hypothetical protein